MTNEQSMKLDIIASYIGSPFTDEQKEFAADFTRDIISFSDPGTGKTHTLVAGIIMAQQYHKVRGQSINCMSFTNAAVSEIAGRYEKLCKTLNIIPTAKFNTFHSLANAVMRQAYPSMRIRDKGNPVADMEDMTAYLNQVGIYDFDKNFPRKVIRAINSLNSALIFHPDNVKERFSFVDLGMSLEAFNEVRKSWFVRGIMLNEIVQGDIPLYCLYALKSKQQIIDDWKGKYKIMIVDEFQDLSLLQMEILSYITDKLIVVGDMKQQIYAFNGACPRIVDAYKKAHPNAVECNLTQSFRCKEKIAEFATKVISPNYPTVRQFTGREGGSVSIIPYKELNWDSLISKFEEDKKTDVMFLYRNNISTLPIIEKLYRKNLPYRCPNYKPIMALPVFSTLCNLVNAVWQPTNLDFVNNALRTFPEFRFQKRNTELPIMTAIKQSGKTLLDINYKFTQQSSVDIIQALHKVKAYLDANKSTGQIFMALMDVYQQHLLKFDLGNMDYDLSYYLNMAAYVCNGKPYAVMYNEEYDKDLRNKDYINTHIGVRCYTMHSAKGMEADDVYLLDCNEGLFPNETVQYKKLKYNLQYDASLDLRSERNLLYVAITRAKNNVTIVYSSEQPTHLLYGNKEDLDYVYESYTEFQDDVGAFYELFSAGQNGTESGSNSVVNG